MENEKGVYLGIETNSKNPVVFDIYKHSANYNGVVFGNLGQGRSFTTVIQKLDSLKDAYPKHDRSYEHKYKSNNWLKLHNQNMRRKPFRKEISSCLDEIGNI